MLPLYLYLKSCEAIGENSSLCIGIIAAMRLTIRLLDWALNPEYGSTSVVMGCATHRFVFNSSMFFVTITWANVTNKLNWQNKKADVFSIGFLLDGWGYAS